MIMRIKKLFANSFKTKGQLAIFMIPMMILVAFLFAVYAADLQHITSVRAQLQNATDAAALAGAQDLWFNIDKAQADALSIANSNVVDGKRLSVDTPGTSIDVVVTPPAGVTPGSVKCTATVAVNHLFGPILGRYTDDITVTSVAGTSGSLYTLAANQAFPLAISLDMVPQLKGGATDKALKACNVGDTFTIYIGSQGVKNGGFTGFKENASAHNINAEIDQALGITKPSDDTIPSMSLGDPINLTNGVDGQKRLAKDPYISLLTDKVLVMPVVLGDPAMNKSRAIVGFIGFQVKSVVNNSGPGLVESITGTLVKPQVPGISGPIPLTGNPVLDQAISRLELGPIQLIR